MTDPAPRRTSYAQNGEDVRAWRALRHVDAPFYVEVGASHPVDDSLTAALSAQGWHGVLVEPEPAAAELLRVARPRDVVVAAAASNEPGLVQWVNDGDRGEGRIAEGRAGLAVPVVRLGDVLSGLGVDQVHFLSVDVEGHELQALLGLDLGRWRPWVLAVEATAPLTRTPTHQAWEPLLLDAGYRFVAFDGLNRWYVSPEHLELCDAVAEPFGVLDVMLDRWERRDVVDLEGRLVEAGAEIDRLREEHRREVLDVADLQGRLVDAGTEIDRLGQEHRTEVQAAAALRRQLDVQELQLAGLQRQVDLVEAQRDAAVARERVMLESRSWRLTSPLRGARRNAWNAVATRRAATRRAATPPPAPPARPDREPTPAEQRRHRALVAKVSAAAARRL